MQRHGRSAKTAGIFGKSRKVDSYSILKKQFIDPKKVADRLLKYFFGLLFSFLISCKNYVLRMISPTSSKETTTSDQKQDKNRKQMNEKNLAKTNLSRKNAGNNWENALKILGSTKSETNKESTTEKKPEKKKKMTTDAQITKYLAIDCEMVGIGPNGVDDMLARVSIVNQKCEVILDKYVKPREPVTDYRTEVSGIRPNNIENAEDFDKVQNEVVKILQGNILVGHSLKNDLSVLFISHPHKYIRDTSRYRPLAKLVSNGATPSLKRLSKSVLGINIQEGEHDSVEDAKAAMAVYNKVAIEWEKQIKKLAQRHKGHHKHGHGHGRKT